MDRKTLAQLPPFSGLEPKTRLNILDAALGVRPSAASVHDVPNLFFHALGGFSDILTPIMLPLIAELGLRSVHFLLPDSHPADFLERKLKRFPGWNPIPGSDLEDDSGPGISLSVYDPQLRPVLIAAMLEMPHDTDKLLLRAAVSLLMSRFDAAVFDLQTAEGTPFSSPPEALAAARKLRNLCGYLNIRSVVMIRDRSRPAENAFGDRPEILEALSTLRGTAPFALLKLILEFGMEILEATGIDFNRVEAKIRMKEILLSGNGAERFLSLVAGAGGDVKACTGSVPPFPPGHVFSVTSDRDGYLHGLKIPYLYHAMEELRINRPDAGFILLRFPGDLLHSGEKLFSVVGCAENAFPSSILRDLRRGIDCRPSPPPYSPLIRHRLK